MQEASPSGQVQFKPVLMVALLTPTGRSQPHGQAPGQGVEEAHSAHREARARVSTHGAAAGGGTGTRIQGLPGGGGRAERQTKSRRLPATAESVAERLRAPALRTSGLVRRPPPIVAVLSLAHSSTSQVLVPLWEVTWGSST